VYITTTHVFDDRKDMVVQKTKHSFIWFREEDLVGIFMSSFY